MVDAYYYNEQKQWLPWRRLYTMLANIGAEKGDEIEESSIMWLPYFDKIEAKNKDFGIPKTQKEIDAIKARNKKGWRT